MHAHSQATKIARKGHLRGRRQMSKTNGLRRQGRKNTAPWVTSSPIDAPPRPFGSLAKVQREGTDRASVEAVRNSTYKGDNNLITLE
jgi:hypothetical protein